MKNLLYGAAYYYEYMPYDRLEKDIEMMKSANINVVRIAESTWGTIEPQDNVFDFSGIHRVLNAMGQAGISVIVGTPTYALPTWLAKKHPEVLAVTKEGRGLYGARQIMDITSPAYLFYAERVIRRLMENVHDYDCVIGYQLDNETNHYNTSGPNVQFEFLKYLKKKFPDLEEFNHEFGLDYWSNRINSWEDLPDIRGTINGSLGAEFEKYLRQQVTVFLSWQAKIINEYRSKDQFITHNFDWEWTGIHYGMKPSVNHFEVAKIVTVAGCDVYHPSQDELTGIEIAFAGDLTRSYKGDNYLILETQAQGFPQWLPYEGQLRLQAFSHIASGANMVSYWPWHSIHNSLETYWKGLLSHDLKENPTFTEAKRIGEEFKKLGKRLVNLKIKNDVAILVSNESLTGMDWFKFPDKSYYNSVLRWVYNVLYKMNIRCDFISPSSDRIEKYKLIVVPALYSAPDQLLHRLNRFVKNGGHLVVTFKSGFTDDYLKVRCSDQPGILSKCCGVTYNQFTVPQNVSLDGLNLPEDQLAVSTWMELLMPTTAQVIASYRHPYWKKYAAITRNVYGKGTATYIGCCTKPGALREVFLQAAKEAGISESDRQYEFPVIIKKAYNESGHEVVFYFNYSGDAQTVEYVHENGLELTEGIQINHGEKITLAPWNLRIIECSESDFNRAEMN